MKTIINVVVVLRSFGEEPDGGPEPVAQRQLGLHLHLPVHEGEAARRPKSKECRISYRIIIIFKFMIYKKKFKTHLWFTIFRGDISITRGPHLHGRSGTSQNAHS